MSESTSAPAPAAAPTPDSAPSSPPPNTQTPLSVSEAGRLLNQARRQSSEAEGRPTPPQPPAQPQQPQRRPSANELTEAAEAARKAAEAPAAPAAPKAAPASLTALERALGVPAADGAEPAAAPSPPTIDGQAIEVDGKRLTSAQVREYVLKATDYTQKTQELAQQRQALAAQQEALAAVLPYIQPELQRLHELVQGVGMPDASMLETDPQGYLKQWAQYQQAAQEQARLGGLTQLQQQAHQRAMEQAVAQANERLAQEFPFWADPAERAAAQQQIVSWATSEKGGFTRDELRGVSSPHHLKTMMKAMAFDRMSERAKTSAPAPALQAPARGSAPPPALTERLQQAVESFDARPSVKTGAALLAARRAR